MKHNFSLIRFLVTVMFLSLLSVSAMATYYSDFVPTMTSNTAPSGVITVSSVYTATYDGWKAFDDNTASSTAWLSANGATTGWIKYEFASQKDVVKYSIQGTNVPGRSPSSWTLQGSNDGVNWTILDTQSSQTNWGIDEVRKYNVSNPGSYKIYKLDITGNNGGGDGLNDIAILEIELFGQFNCPLGIVSYWTFDDGTATDTVGNNNGTLVNNPTVVSGKVGNALYFDGVDDYVEVLGSTDLDIAGDMTIAMWIKPVSLPTSTNIGFIAKRALSGGSARWHFGLNNDISGYNFYNSVAEFQSSKRPSNNNWSFIVMVLDSGVDIKYFTNATLVDTVAGAYMGSSLGEPLTIARSGVDPLYKGIMDEVVIFNRVLNSSEIQQLYQDTLNGKGYCSSSSNSSTSSIEPNYTTFSSSETTNFSALSDLTNVTAPVIATSQAKIEWAGSGYNADGKDFDSAITITHNFVSVDVSKLDNTFNRTANLTLKTVTYPSLYAYEILRNGQPCGAPECVKISANPVKFKVSHFSNYTTNGTGVVPEFNSGLIIVLLVFTVLFTIVYKAKK